LAGSAARCLINNYFFCQLLCLAIKKNLNLQFGITLNNEVIVLERASKLLFLQTLVSEKSCECPNGGTILTLELVLFYSTLNQINYANPT
jgi:hypothetical protein